MNPRILAAAVCVAAAIAASGCAKKSGRHNPDGVTPPAGNYVPPADNPASGASGGSGSATVAGSSGTVTPGEAPTGSSGASGVNAPAVAPSDASGASGDSAPASSDAAAQARDFAENWCEPRLSQPINTQKTVERLLQEAATHDCEAAGQWLASQTSLDLSSRHKGETKIHDLRPVAIFVSLTELNLAYNPLSPDDLKALWSLTRLERLVLSQAQARDGADVLAQLKSYAPKCEIEIVDDIPEAHGGKR